MFNRAAMKEHLRGMRRYAGISFVLFCAGIFIGAVNTEFQNFLDSQLAALGQLVQTVNESNNPTVTMMIVIFLNNAIKSVLIMAFGAFFGVLPVVFLLINGMVIGYLLQLIADEPTGPTVMEVIFKGLLPHGIIEIPAIIIACAYGLRFGVLTLKVLGSVLFARAKLDRIGGEFQKFIVWILPAAFVLTLSLLVAAVIESTFTVWLMGL